MSQIEIQPKITPCLWFDRDAEMAAAFYTSVFPDSAILQLQRYGSDGPLPEGTVLTVSFTLSGQPFLALNGGPVFHFNEAISLVINCDDQAEIDYYWERLSEGGQRQQCGWLKDRFGLSWQVTPVALARMLADGSPAQNQRMMAALMQMIKIDLGTLEAAYRG